MVRWLVIGIGDITRRRVIPAILANPRSQLQALVTRDPAKALAYPGAQVFSSLDQALETGEFDAVYVASPVFLHAPQSIAALRAGKHVLCEKPMAMSFTEAESMVQAARATECSFAVAYYRRLFPKLLRAQQLMRDGAIGEPVLAEANCHSALQTDQPNWERNWMLHPESAGGGPLYDIGSHRIDALNFLFGEPLQAKGIVSNRIHQLAVEDSATVLIRYPLGIHAVVDVRWNSRIGRDQFRIIGTEGELNLDPLSGPALRYADREESWPTPKNVHALCIDNFVAAVLDGVPLSCPGDAAIMTDWVTSQALSTMNG